MALTDKYINPLTDFGFKKLFGSEPNKILLMSFLNEILPEKHQIEELTYAQNEHLSNAEIDRKAIFDIYCKSATGERFIVEIQKAKQNFFKDRSVYYSSFPIQEQAQKGDWGFKLESVYTVGILDFMFEDEKGNPDYLHLVELKNQHGKVFYQKLKFIFIELPKFTKKESELETIFDKWLFVFRHLANLQNRPKALQERVFKTLFEKAEIAKFEPQERQAYENSLKYYRDLNNVVDTARQEGEEKGREEGREEGKVEGILAVAEKMKLKGVSVAEIAEMTGLSKDEIINL